MLKRIAVYLNEMFPVTAFIGSVISAVSVQLVYLRLYGIRPSWSLSLLLPGLVLTMISLLLRIMDEFKDYQDDLTNFPNRPLPSGRVMKKDLAVLGAFCVVAVVFLSSTSVPVLLWGLICLAFTGLMFKWFFIEDIMRKSLPLAFVTHHPIVILNFIYLIVASIEMDKRVGWDRWYYIVPVCLIYTNWELMRKIRAPEQETAYTTYSKIMGPRPAILTALSLQLIFIGSVMLIFRELGSPLLLQIVFLLIQLALAFPGIRFLFSLKLKAPLKPNAEGQILVVVGFLLAAALL